MKVKRRHRNLIQKRLHGNLDVILIESIRKFPKPVKFHVHITDGWTANYYLFKIRCRDFENKELVLYCQLSPIILDLYYNVTFWTVGEKWMNRYKLNWDRMM